MRTLGGLLVAMVTVLAGSLGVAPAAQACYATDCEGLTYLSLGATSPVAGHRARIRVVVREASAQSPVGEVVLRLRDRRKTIDTFRVAYEGEAVRLRTGRLAAGKYFVTAAFTPDEGSEARAASSSTTFRVRRR